MDHRVVATAGVAVVGEEAAQVGRTEGRGQVVDYINFLFMDFAIFNFADICVTVGVALLFVYVLWAELKERKKKSSGEEPAADADA